MYLLIVCAMQYIQSEMGWRFLCVIYKPGHTIEYIADISQWDLVNWAFWTGCHVWFIVILNIPGSRSQERDCKCHACDLCAPPRPAFSLFIFMSC